MSHVCPGMVPCRISSESKAAGEVPSPTNVLPNGILEDVLNVS